ncbi:MAG: efflux RND transporter periplasmic adaptor subunit [Phaeodactylibacter sp.]|uniref:efflux RND transporter periplasmic adaptor subunit n=1 Tax=Phaeodactylibacter sp. TaxID=1940289 RepID=UPI0032EE63FA
MIKKWFVFLAVGFMLCQCAPSSGNSSESDGTTMPASITREPVAGAVVRTVSVVRKDFAIQVFSSGTLTATRQADIQAQVSGSLQELFAREGQRFKKGAALAVLDSTALVLELEKANLQLKEAVYNKDDQLVMQGGTWGVDTSVNAETLDNILIRSGLSNARHTIKKLKYKWSQMVIRAPFDGIVADVAVKPFKQLTGQTTICRLIDPESFVAAFQLLERDAMDISIGQGVSLSPVANPGLQLKAQISRINPVVSSSGLVRIQAKISARDIQTHADILWEGMKMNVVIEKRIPGQLVVPKSALVLRSGREVVFVYDEAEKRAKWKYVSFAYENESEVAITEGLQPGELVITEGNLNLDHDAEVVLADIE